MSLPPLISPHHLLLLPLLFILLPPTLPQDISFPSQNDSPTTEDTEVVQLYPSAQQVPYVQQPMVEEHLSGGGPAGPITELGFGLHRGIKAGSGRDYFIYSPTSIATALYLILLGSRGPTYTEIEKILGATDSSTYLQPQEEYSSILRSILQSNNENMTINIANGIFVQNDFPIRADYRDNIKNLYQATLHSLDFKLNPPLARDVINSWISEKTSGKIQKLLNDPPPRDTKLIMVNTLYFKSDWKIPFPNELTKLGNFYTNGRSQPAGTKIPIMATGGVFKYYFDPNLNCEVVGLPYKGDSVVFYIVLPRNSNKEKVKNIENTLTNIEINKLLNNSVFTPQMIVAIPKMKLKSEYNLNAPLKELGVRAIFNPEVADLSLLSSGESPRQASNIFEKNEDRFIFTRMKVNETRKKRQTRGFMPPNSKTPRSLQGLTNPGLYATQILHKIVIDINEKGTEAAAVTAVSIEKSVSHTVRVDGPFLFFIRHEATGMILFWGSVVTPPSN